MKDALSKAMHTSDHLTLRFECRILDADLHHEAVQLGFGQWVCSFVFNRVLSRKDRQYGRKRMRGSVDRDLALLHGLQQRRLCFCRSAVDFIRKYDIGKQRSGTEPELGRL